MSISDYFGILSAILLFASIIYALRRRLIRQSLNRKVGSATIWRNAHIYLGTAFAITFLAHTKFSLPVGAFSWLLFILSLWTIITGALGWYLQWFIPRKLTALSKTEIIYERIPELCTHLRESAKAIAEPAPAILADLHDREIASYLSKLYIYTMASSNSILENLERVKLRLSSDQYGDVEAMAACVRNKYDLDVHFTLQTVLRMWIYLHAPASFVLLVLVMFHIFAVIYY